MLVVFWNKGQLGNRLFYFAHFIAFSIETGSKALCLFFNKDERKYTPLFKGTRNNYIGHYPGTIIRTRIFAYRVTDWILYKLFLFAKRFKMNNRFISIYTPSIEGRKDSQTYTVFDMINDNKRKRSVFTFYNGHIFWFDNTDLAKYHKNISPYFIPSEPYRTNISDYILSLKKEYPGHCIVGVHIRRRDYREWANGIWFFDDDAYFSHMNRIKDELLPKNTVFVICSDEDVNTDHFPGLVMKRSTGNIIEDMYILSECDYILGPHSTYSMWASYYGQKPLYKMQKETNSFSLPDFRICNGRFYKDENSN
jgi:hypothetical protein